MVHRQKPKKKYNKRLAEKQVEKKERIAPAAMQSVGLQKHQRIAQKFLRDHPDRLTALIRDGISEEHWKRYSKFDTKKLTRGKHIGGAGIVPGV